MKKENDRDIKELQRGRALLKKFQETLDKKKKKTKTDMALSMIIESLDWNIGHSIAFDRILEVINSIYSTINRVVNVVGVVACIAVVAVLKEQIIGLGSWLGKIILAYVLGVAPFVVSLSDKERGNLLYVAILRLCSFQRRDLCGER